MLAFLRRLLGFNRASDTSELSGEDSFDGEDPFPEVVKVPFSDVLDLHSIPPAQVKAVVQDYLEEAHLRGVRYMRIIHGKGVGVQREMVRSVLARTAFVSHFSDAPPEAGGFGATLVTLSIRD